MGSLKVLHFSDPDKMQEKQTIQSKSYMLLFETSNLPYLHQKDCSPSSLAGCKLCFIITAEPPAGWSPRAKSLKLPERKHNWQHLLMV